jgi:membrane associated rhomboid family serine protease
MLPLWFGNELLMARVSEAVAPLGGSGVAYWAHVGGFVAGLLLIKVFATRRSSAADGPRFPVY